jgi:hypothetical protein
LSGVRSAFSPMARHLDSGAGSGVAALKVCDQRLQRTQVFRSAAKLFE